MEGTSPASNGKYFSELNAALAELQATSPALRTHEFTRLVDCVLNVFDYLGMVMGFAKVEASGKCTSLKEVENKYQTLATVVAADKRAGTVTTKNSRARNLHRLMMMVSFIRQLMEKLMSNPSMGLREAAVDAYAGSLQPYHTYVLRTAIWAGLYALPSREAFMKALGETEETAHLHASAFIGGAKDVLEQLETLYDGPMPASDVSWWSASNTSVTSARG